MKLTRVGWITILLTLILGFGAVNTGNNLLYLLVSALLGFILLSGWMGRGNLSGLQIDLRLPEEIYAGRETRVAVQVRNRRRFLPACLLRVEMAQGDAFCPLLRGGRGVRVSLAITLPTRGIHRLPPIRVSSAYPVGFFVRRMSWSRGQEALVFPRPRPLSVQQMPGRGEDQGRAFKDRGYEGDLAWIADYRGTEPLKFIHWKMSARQDDLKVKELSSMAAQPLLIVVRLLPGATLEERLEEACWLIRTLMKRDQSVGLELTTTRIAPGWGRQHQRRLLRALALYDSDSHTS